MILRLRPTSGAGRFFRFSRMTESTISPHNMHRQPLKFIYPVSSLKSLNSSSIISLWHRGQSILHPSLSSWGSPGIPLPNLMSKEDAKRENSGTIKNCFLGHDKNCFNPKQSIWNFLFLKQSLMTGDGPMVQGKTEIGIDENNESRDQDDQHKQKDRHFFFRSKDTSPAQTSPSQSARFLVKNLRDGILHLSGRNANRHGLAF